MPPAVTRRRVLQALAAAAALGASAQPARAQPLQRVRFQLDWRFDGQTAPFFLGLAKGYFKQEGLDVQFDSGAGSAMAVNRLASGNYDLGYGDTSALIEFLSNNFGNPLAQIQAVYMVLESTPAGAIVMKKSGIAKPADLAGRTLGAPVFDAGRKLFPLFAQKNGLDVKAVKWQSMEPALREQMLVRGQVDGITGFQPSTMISAIQLGAKEDELTVFNYKDYGVKAYGNAILAAPAFQRNHPQAISAFLRAYNRALKETIANPEEAVRYVKERDPLVDTAVELRRLKGQLEQFVATPTARANGLGAIEKLRLEQQVEDVVRAFGLKATPSADLIFNSSYLPDRAARRL